MIDFARHYVEIRKGGFQVITRKALSFLRRVAALARQKGIFLASLPVALLIRAARPLVFIRFGQLSTERIGHLTFEPDLYLCRKSREGSARKFDFFYSGDKLCNTVLLDLWRGKLRIWEWARYADFANRQLPGFGAHTIPQHVLCHADPEFWFTTDPANVAFDEALEKQALAQCAERNIPLDKPIICVHMRDSAYLQREYPAHDFAYHDYRDADINNYRLAAEKLAQGRNTVIRMGSVVKEALTSADPGIIDYSQKAPTDLLDLFIISRCKFLLGTSSGPCAIAWMFRRPVAFANVTPLLGLSAARAGDLFIPKLYWLKNEQKYMRFGEIFRSGAGDFIRIENFNALGIELVENTAEEIAELADEMNQRLDGTWQDTEQDSALQSAFQAIFFGSTDLRHSPFAKGRRNGEFPFRIGSRFLLRHRALLA